MAIGVIANFQGYPGDYIQLPYSSDQNTILGYLNTGYYHVHGTSFVYPNRNNAIQITSGAGAWSISGNITEVAPANALNLSAFDLHWINISDISASCQLQIDIFAGDIGEEILIGAAKASRTSVFTTEGAHRIQIPQQLVNTRISCRLIDSTAGTISCDVSFEGHYYTL